MRGDLKKLTAFIPALFFVVLVFGMPSTASAFTGSGAGTSGSPFIITSCDQLQEMEDARSATYKLASDIDCSATSGWNAGAGFDPVGVFLADFSGTLDGNGKKITSLFINRPTATYVGLFGYMSGTVTDVGLEGVDFTGGTSTVGGLVAGNLGTITKSYSTGEVRGPSYVGGLAGGNFGSIADSFSMASVSGTYVGGLVGLNNAGAIDNAYSTGLVTGASAPGGLVHQSINGATVTDSFWDTDTSGQATSDGGTGKTTVQMKTGATFTGAGWDFSGIWNIAGTVNSGYPFFAHRYWVGGTGTWDGVDTSHWSYFSGGAGGAAVPTVGDDCFFDDNSFSGGGQTVTLSGAGYCEDMTWTTTDAPTLTSAVDLNINGSLELASGMTFSFSSGAIYFNAVDARTITSNGVTVDAHFYFMTSGTWTLQDNLIVEEYFALTQGTFDANDFDVTTGSFYSSNTNTRSLIMGSGDWLVTGTGTVWDISNTTGLTFDSTGSFLEFTDQSVTQKDFYGGGLSYNDVFFGGGSLYIQDSNTYSSFGVSAAAATPTLYITSGTTQTFTDFAPNTGPGFIPVILSTFPGTPFAFCKTSGTVSVDYIDITDSSATCGATWYAGANSIDGGGNTGWIFTVPPAPVAAPIAGTYTGTQNVTLTSPGSTTIRYTTDGTTPNCSGSTLYSGAFAVVSSLTVKAIGCFGSGTNPSAVGSFAYVINMSSGGGGGGGGGYYLAPQPSATPTPMVTPTPFPQAPRRGDPANLPRLGLHEGQVVGDTDPNDPDVFIVNIWGYKRLFLNPLIYSFYGHLSALKGLKHITPPDRDSLPTSGLFRNCETQDPKVYALEVTGEDTGTLHWVNITGAAAVAQDPDFFKKDFCINNSEFNWYIKSPMPYTSLSQLPTYRR